MTEAEHPATMDPEAERAVLGGVLLDNTAVTLVAPMLRPMDFALPAHAVIYDAILRLTERQLPVDVVTLAAELRVQDRLNTIGGVQFIGELTDALPTAAHIVAHAGIVRELARTRRAIEACQSALYRLRSGAPVGAAQAALGTAFADDDPRGPAARVGSDLEDLFETTYARREGRERPLATPWPRVDTLLGGGWWPGMYVLVGGTGMGKTQWAVQAAVSAARTGVRVLYLALELARRDLAARVVGALAGVPWSGLLRGTMSDEDLVRAQEAGRVVQGLPLYTECAPPYGYGAEALAARAWSLRPTFIVLDYLQLCSGRAGEDLRVGIGRAAYTARALARDLGAVVLVLSSTARENYGRLEWSDDRDPADLVGTGKESGEVEYAADGVLVLARQKDAARSRERVLVVAKNRHGPLGAVDLRWNGTAFEAMDAEGTFRW